MAFERWEIVRNAGWGLARTLSSTVSVVSLNSFGSRLQCLQLPCPKAQRCPWEHTNLCEVITPELQGFLILESYTWHSRGCQLHARCSQVLFSWTTTSCKGGSRTE